MFKEIEIKGLVTRMTLVEIDEDVVNRLKSIYDNNDWWETYLALDELLLSDDRAEFTHITRQGVDMQSVECSADGGYKNKFSGDTPVEQVKTISDRYSGKYVVVQSMIGFTQRKGNIKCEVFEEDMLRFMLEYWNGTDELISCDSVLYDGQVYEFDEISMSEESLYIEVGKFNQGYLESVFRLDVK